MNTLLKRYFFHIAYMGKHYSGWQRQKNIRSVQQTIEDTIAQILKRQSCTIIGCGRTDAGVHASQFYFHTDLDMDLDDAFKKILNLRLPDDIAVFDIIPSSNRLHARFDATSRSYQYFIALHKNPYLKDYTALMHGKNVDWQRMQKAVSILPDYDDYRPFCKQPDVHNTTICRVSTANLHIDKSQSVIRFSITANRFLRGQIRIIVQKLMDIGTGKFSLEAFENCLQSRQTPQLIKPAPASGLFLSKVEYPDIIFDNKATFAISNDSWQEI